MNIVIKLRLIQRYFFSTKLSTSFPVHTIHRTYGLRCRAYPPIHVDDVDGKLIGCLADS